MDDELGRLFLNCSASRLEQLSGRIAACLAKLNSEQVWARGTENENAIGNLVLHLCGNVRQWILSAVGGAPDARQRDAEFSARGNVEVGDLAGRLRVTVEDALAILRAFPSARQGLPGHFRRRRAKRAGWPSFGPPRDTAFPPI